jgi:hypothetical protein
MNHVRSGPNTAHNGLQATARSSSGRTGAQEMHKALPSTGELKPARHALQLELPDARLTLPMGHGRQRVCSELLDMKPCSNVSVAHAQRSCQGVPHRRASCANSAAVGVCKKAGAAHCADGQPRARSSLARRTRCTLSRGKGVGDASLSSWHISHGGARPGGYALPADTARTPRSR